MVSDNNNIMIESTLPLTTYKIYYIFLSSTNHARAVGALSYSFLFAFVYTYCNDALFIVSNYYCYYYYYYHNYVTTHSATL